MSSVVTAVMARSYQPDMFADLGLWPQRSWDKQTGVTTLTFAEDLTAAQVSAIWWRMTSRDAADEAARRDIAAKLAAVDQAPVIADCADVRALVEALAEYLLGDVPGDAP